MTFFRRYWDDVKKFSRDTFLRVAVFCTAIWCIFVHFDYLKMRAKGRLSRWFFVPEWKVLRDDKGGHELGSTEQYVPFPRARFVGLTFRSMDRLYEPVEEHRRAAFIALMDREYGAGPRSRSQSPTLSDIPRESFSGRGSTTQEGTTEALRVPSDANSESLAVIEKFTELIHRASMAKNTDVSGEPYATSPIQMQQAGPSGIGMSPYPPSRAFSQYSIHPDSSEPSDRNSMQITTAPRTRKPKLPPLSLHPSRKIRSFKTSAHSQGETIWMSTASYEDLSNPPEPVPGDEPGVLYIHRNLTDNTVQVWLLGIEKQWTGVQLSVMTQHPTFRDRYLAIRLNGTPSWITLASWYTAKKWVNSR